MPRYAISDIHGCCKTFRYMVEEELRLQPQDHLYLLGDYIDRGPDSKGVLEYIMSLREKGYQVTTLSGNHEDMLLHARDNAAHRTAWLRISGGETLKSFDAESLDGISPRYWDFLEQLELYVALEDYLLVHAGFDFSLQDPFSDRESMLWIRHFEVDVTVLGNRKIVHGHTPTPLSKMEHSLKTEQRPVINIDGGCTYWAGYGYLTALNLDTLQLHRVRNRET
ncbi:serine/threonine protein phosphatase [Rufibacter immobilis]|uniref:Serine/threonine protein phosphatase n=1 Tax=Rufibacter immobilis TaxID=1348778 RepID=A0A3M9MPQ8_9BACT|nr:metallophosphoesterase family protein [Rufibacter immobilis]RNI27512.1 serine/threonine protein phosphatase [Rufibacter immobilis]